MNCKNLLFINVRHMSIMKKLARSNPIIVPPVIPTPSTSKDVNIKENIKKKSFQQFIQDKQSERSVNKTRDASLASLVSKSLKASDYVPLPVRITPPDITKTLTPPIPKFEQPKNAELAKIALIGIASAGKSTIVNALVGEKVSIVSQRPQSTRERVLGIFTKGNKQVILMDTPGLPSPKAAEFARHLESTPSSALEACDHVVAVVDAQLSCKTFDGSLHPVELNLIKKLQQHSKSVTLVLNKFDSVESKTKLEKVLQTYKDLYPFEQIIRMSAFNSDHVITLKTALLRHTTPQPWIYPSDRVSDISDVDRVQLLVREAYMDVLHGHLPYTLQHQTTGWTELDNGLRIDHTIIVEKPAHRIILIGSRQNVQNLVSERVGKELSRIYQKPVTLILNYKVAKE